MTRYAALATLAILIAGCDGGKVPVPVPASPLARSQAPAGPPGQLTSKTLELFLYDKKMGETQSQKPRLGIVAENGTFSEDQTWSIEKVRATIHSTRGEDVFLEASQGTLDQRKDQEKAYLRGGVKLQTGTTQVQMGSVQWLNEEGVVRSEEPVSITGDNIQMTGQSLVYYPDDDILELSNVTLTIDLKGTQER